MSQSFSFLSNKQEFYAQKWEAVDTQAVMCLVHGHGEHIGRYDRVADFLKGAGITTMGFDLYGHGKTKYKKGHWPNYEAVMDSIATLIEEAQKQYAGKPLFLYGHSLGGNLAVNFALRRKPKIAGLILSAPWLKLAFDPSSTDLFLAKMMLNIYPSFTQSSKLDATAISRDPKEVEKYVNDPLVHDLISPQMFTTARQAGLWALEHAGQLELPLLLFHGDADRLTSFEASEAFAAKAGGGAVSFHPFEGYYHELHNEAKEHREPILHLMKDWMGERI